MSTKPRIGSFGWARSAALVLSLLAVVARDAPAEDPAHAARDARWRGTRYVVVLGDMQNHSEVLGPHASEVLRAATRTRVGTIPGALFVENNDAGTLQQAAARHVPVFQLDGALQRLRAARKDVELSYNAQVDYGMRQMPQQQLRGMLSGSATSFGSVSALRNPGIVTMLEDQAIEAAVESALRGAARGLGAAGR